MYCDWCWMWSRCKIETRSLSILDERNASASFTFLFIACFTFTIAHLFIHRIWISWQLLILYTNRMQSFSAIEQQHVFQRMFRRKIANTQVMCLSTIPPVYTFRSCWTYELNNVQQHHNPIAGRLKRFDNINTTKKRGICRFAIFTISACQIPSLRMQKNKSKRPLLLHLKAILKDFGWRSSSVNNNQKKLPNT